MGRYPRLRDAVLDRLVATRGLDVQRFSVTPIDVEWAVAHGITARDLGMRIRDAGYDVVVDPIVGWYGGTPHPTSRFGRFGSDHTIRMSAELGAVALNLIGQPTREASNEHIATYFSVQIADARAQVLPEIRDDTQQRALPGDGVLDLVAIVRVLHRIGALNWIGPEVIAADLAALPTAVAAELADARTRQLIAHALADQPAP